MLADVGLIVQITRMQTMKQIKAVAYNPKSHFTFLLYIGVIFLTNMRMNHTPYMCYLA